MPTVSKGPSYQERFLLHTEIQMLQQKFGLSYKDAAHHLYMAEVERVKKAYLAARAFHTIWQQLDHLVVENIILSINSIDKGK